MTVLVIALIAIGAVYAILLFLLPFFVHSIDNRMKEQLDSQEKVIAKLETLIREIRNNTAELQTGRQELSLQLEGLHELVKDESLGVRKQITNTNNELKRLTPQS